MKFVQITALAASLGVSAPAVQAQDLVYWDTVGGWEILVDPTLGNGCLIQAEFDNGALVRIGFDRTEDLGYITAFHDDWGDIVEDQVYPITFDLDGQSYDGEATGIYLEGMPGADVYFDNPDFLFDLARKNTLTLHNESGGVMSIDLEGSFVALEAAIDCQDQQG
ncbi:hypothetical protein ATO6_05235 [Oceanicola sp. 22II-s10i]|uniref:hypothetical protein n=1 Tax=Oceanicola sp. 22II-s10i TaxID=1317116 RepID=UPI000B528C4F|nr:hypothetical protein [Oceanicola sp. 22II-s10i]OWU86241.1 hypothetical protein ATO6_05235 [Oceanicola sp. 22II-s10i]